MEDVHPRNKEPDPARPAPGVESGKAHGGSRIRYDMIGIGGSLTCTSMYYSVVRQVVFWVAFSIETLDPCDYISRILGDTTETYCNNVKVPT
jgi:hypothetical protein